MEHWPCFIIINLLSGYYWLSLRCSRVQCDACVPCPLASPILRHIRHRDMCHMCQHWLSAPGASADLVTRSQETFRQTENVKWGSELSWAKPGAWIWRELGPCYIFPLSGCHPPLSASMGGWKVSTQFLASLPLLPGHTQKWPGFYPAINSYLEAIELIIRTIVYWFYITRTLYE